MSTSEQARLWTWPYALTLLSTLSFFGSFFYLISVLPDYVNDIGGSPFEVGLIVSAFAIIPLLTRPVIGRLADGGHRVRMLQIGVGSLIGSFALMTISEDIWSLFVLRIAQGIGMAMFPTAAGSMVAELSPLPRRGEGVGYFGMSSSTAQMLFPALGVWILGHWGFNVVFLVAAGTAAFTFLLVSTMSEPDSAVPTPAGGARSELLPRATIFPMAVFMTVTFAIGAATSFLPLLNNERDLGNVGMYFFFIGGVSVIGRPLAGSISDRYGRAVIMAPALIAAVAGMIVLALAQTTELMLLSGALGGIGLAGTHTGAFALSLDRVRDNQRGSATAIFQWAWDIGGLASGPALGIVASTISTSAVFWTAAIIAASGLVLLLYGHSVGWTCPLAPVEKHRPEELIPASDSAR